MAIPSQASYEEGVETRRAESFLGLRDGPDHKRRRVFAAAKAVVGEKGEVECPIHSGGTIFLRRCF